MSIFLIIILFSALILVHEWGHFIVARLNRVKVEEFGLGIPPRLFGIYKEKGTRRWKFVGPKRLKMKSAEQSINHPTVYSFNILPIGGFVRIFGEDMQHERYNVSFSAKSAWVRSAILAAGALMNLLFASILFTILLSVGIRTIVSVEQEQGLVERGIPFTTPVIRITDIALNSPAEKAGLHTDDIIVGLQAESDKLTPVSTINDVQLFITKHAGTSIQINVLRGTKSTFVELIPRIDVPENEGPTGIILARTADVSFPWYEALWKGISFTFDRAWLILYSLGALFVGLLTASTTTVEVSGPVGIVAMAHSFALLGYDRLLYFGAIISISLAIFNLLPIPALDGGRILFVALEKIRGKAVRPDLEQKIHGVAFLLLICLILFVTWGDIRRIFFS